MCMCMYACMHACMYACTYAGMCICVCVCVCIYIYKFIFTLSTHAGETDQQVVLAKTMPDISSYSCDWHALSAATGFKDVCWNTYGFFAIGFDRSMIGMPACIPGTMTCRHFY